MDSSQSNNSAGERRLSTAASERSTSNSHANSDESYHLEDIIVADGFRPSNPEPEPEPTNPTSQPDSQLAAPQPLLLSPLSRIAPPSQPISLSPPAQTTSSNTTVSDITNKGNPGPSIPRPSSVSKPYRPHESLTLRNDGSSAAIDNSSPNSQQTDESPLAHNESNGQPTSSLFGSSTEATRTNTTNSPHPLVERTYDGPHGPTHPYALYPQNTTSEELSNQHIPVGFPGHGIAYRRQIGPDGEEIGDLIGPLGHLEELPPYTRYPEQTYLRGGAGTSSTDGSGSNGPSNPTGSGSNGASFVSAPDTISWSPPGSSPGSPQNAVPAPLPVHPGAGGIGLATRDPEYSSTDGSLVAANSQGSIESANTSSNTSHGIGIAARDFAEKLPMGKWQRRARKKLWGIIPYWALCLLVMAMVIVGVVLGAVVGTILTKDGVDGGFDYPSGEVPRPADVEPLTILPENLTGLAVGPWDLPPLRVGQSPNMCFNDTTQSEAWNCDLPLRWYSLNIAEIPDADDVENFELTLTPVNGSDTMFLWGTQQPNIYKPETLRLVNDSFQESRGPAWWFKMNYNKVVILPEDNLNSPDKEKRDWSYTGPPRPGFDPTRFMSQNPGPQDGEKPWFCTWPNTTMEVFIYPSQNISVRYTSTSSSASISSSPTSSITPSETPLPSYDSTPAYPQVMKFMERRLFMDGDEEAATCQQVLITNGGRDKEYLYNGDGHPIEVRIIERYRTYEELVEASERDRHPGDSSSRRWLSDPFEKRHNPFAKRKAMELTDCGCLWWSS